MGINWDLVLRIGGPLLGVFAGWALTRFTERRSKLITYYGHVGTLTAQQQTVHTHVVVIRNVGRKPASNVRVSHHFLPGFNIWPPVKHTVEDVAGSGKDIVIPTLVPGEQVTINYLYFPPTTVQNVTRSVKSDEGFAQVVNALLIRQYPRWGSAHHPRLDPHRLHRGSLLAGVDRDCRLASLALTDESRASPRAAYQSQGRSASRWSPPPAPS